MENQDIWETISASENSDNIPWDKIVTTYNVDNMISVVPRREIATIKIKYLPGAPHLEMMENGDWCDLYTFEEVTLHVGDFKIIPLGFAAKLPEGYEANIVPRSSTFKRWGILQTNHFAVIDESYCGNDDEWGYPVYATRDITIPAGTRLCQFRINKKQPQLVFEEVSDLQAESRGGFGSTGA